MKITRKAFSLIELLIVITIIGILAVAFLPSITTGPSRARDTQRVADISDIALALELYFQDTGAYPVNAGGLDDADSASAAVLIASYFDNGAVPTDPQSDMVEYGDPGFYYYEGTASNYVLLAAVENSKAAEEYCDMPTTITLPFSCTALTPITYNGSGIDPVYVYSKG